MIKSSFFYKPLLFVLAFLPLFSLGMTSIAIGLFFIGAFYQFLDKKRIYNMDKTKTPYVSIFWLSLPLLLFIVSLLRTKNLDQGLSFILRSLVFFIFPFTLFFFNPLRHRKDVTHFIKLYILSSGLFALAMLFFLMFKIYMREVSYAITDYQNVLKMREYFDHVPIINEHPIYITMILGLALIFLYYERFKNRWLNLLITTLLICLIFIVSSRGPIIALIVTFSGILFFEATNLWKSFGALFLLITVTAVTTYYSPLKSRILEISNTRNLYPQGVHYNSFNLRMGIYKCGLNIAKHTPILGYGAGDTQGLLNTCYAVNYDTDAYQKQIYNTHNQYLFYWISFGPLGFIIIIISYFVFLKKSILNNNRMYSFFLIFCFISFLFENILSRNTGIMLFCVFNSIFYQVCCENEKNLR